MIKKCIVGFLSICILFGAMLYPGETVTVQAQETVSSTTADSSEWTIRGDYLLYSYKGSATEVIIPDTLDGVTITSLYSPLFSSKVKEALISVTFPNTIKTIPSGLLSDATSLTHTTIPEGIETLSARVFNNCSSLTEITLPDSLTSIGSYAFEKCTSLKQVTIPKNVTSIGKSAFASCTSLTEFIVDPQNPSYVSVDGVLYTKDKSELVCYPAGKAYTGILDQTTSIGGGAFSGHTTLTSITLSNRITHIKDDAFRNCADLTEIVLPDQLTDIGASAFYHCGKLSDISIPESVNSIGQSAFLQCQSLTSVKLPENLTVLENHIFSSCYSLQEAILPENLTKICNSAFIACHNLTSVTIPDTVTEMEYDIFGWCSALGSIKLPKNLKTLGSCVTFGCSSIQNIIIPEGTVSLGASQFFDIPNLGYVIIPASVKDFGIQATTPLGFWNRSTGTYCCYKDSLAEQFAIKNEIPYLLIGKDIFVCGDYIYTIQEDQTVKILAYAGDNPQMSIPGTIDGRKVTAIQGANTTKENKWVTSVVLPNETTSIEGFWNYKNLSEIFIPESVTEIILGTLPYTESLTLKGIEGSYAQAFAYEYGYAWESVSPWDSPDMNTNTDNDTNIDTDTDIGTGTDIGTDINTPKHTHTYSQKITRKATCTSSGTRTYTCTGCNNRYTETIPASGHNYKKSLTKATIKRDGAIREICSICSKIKSTTVISHPKKMSLNKTDYIYNGTTKKPSVTIKDAAGKKLRENKDYQITWPKGRKNPGNYTVTVKFKGNYTGTMSKTFTIRPKGTSLKTVTAKSKGFQVTWKKQTTQVSGYQVQYCIGGNFKNKQTTSVYIKSNTTVKKTISGLKKKQKYYIRIRTYKTVKENGKNVTLYSDWSNTKTIRTKK